jgi:hypothetical protein
LNRNDGAVRRKQRTLMGCRRKRRQRWSKGRVEKMASVVGWKMRGRRESLLERCLSAMVHLHV